MKAKKMPFLWAAALVLAACGPRNAGDPEDASKLVYAPEVNEVEVVTLRRQTFPMQLVANGKLGAAQRSVLYFAQSGLHMESIRFEQISDHVDMSAIGEPPADTE